MASAYFWEDSDQLNLIATFLDPQALGSVRAPDISYNATTRL